MVWAYVRRRVNSVEDAEDLVVEVFATAWRRSDDLERADSSVAWLLGIARNLILNHRRRSRRQSLLLDKMRRTSRYVTIDPHDAAERDQGVRQAFEALSSLKELDQEILLLATYEELSHEQIADVIGASATAVRSRLFRARKKLREEFDLTLNERTQDIRRAAERSAEPQKEGGGD